MFSVQNHGGTIHAENDDSVLNLTDPSYQSINSDMSLEFSNFDVNETETDMVHSNNRINNVEPVSPVMPASIDIEKKVNEDDLLEFIFVNTLKRTTSDYNRAKAKFGDIHRPLFEKLARSAQRCAA